MALYKINIIIIFIISPEYSVLARFHVPLITIAEREFGYSETVTCTGAPPTDKRAGTPDPETESITKKVHCDD